jgi:cysteine synthase
MLFALGSGFKVILCVPANVCPDPERIKLLKLFGVKLMVTISCYSQFRNNIELLDYENL